MARVHQPRPSPARCASSFLSAQNFYGLDILPFAVEIAKVTMMIARKLAIDELHITEPALPLDNLDQNFIAADALLTPDGQPAPWPKADVIIGNPPFLGAKRLKPERGPDYVNALRRAYPDVPGMADYCVYWFRKAHDHLPPCTAADPVAGRAGLVGTQNIRNNQSRVGGLDHVVKTGTIVEAVDNQPWSGEANVHVSIANWVKTQDAALLPKARKLWFKVEPDAGGQESRASAAAARQPRNTNWISASAPRSTRALSDETDVSGAIRLNLQRRAAGVLFRSSSRAMKASFCHANEAAEMIESDARNAAVLHPFLIGSDMLTGDGSPTEWVIDFQTSDHARSQRFSQNPSRTCRPSSFRRVSAKRRKARLPMGSSAPITSNSSRYWWQSFL